MIMSDSNQPLWDSNHPYYCNQSNYYATTTVEERYSSWQAFLKDFGDCDMDLNLVFRWDWLCVEDDDSGALRDDLLIFFLGQRKGRYYFARVCDIQKSEEPSVRAWLQPRLDYLLELWAPMQPATSKKAEED
jgi:hypothetical protein